MYENLDPKAALERAAYVFGEHNHFSHFAEFTRAKVELVKAALRFYEDQQKAPVQRDTRPDCPETVVLNMPDNPKLHGRTMVVDRPQTHYRGLVGTIPDLYASEGRVFYDVTWDQVHTQH